MWFLTNPLCHYLRLKTELSWLLQKTEINGPESWVLPGSR